MGDIALLAVFIYTGAGAARLARFNVMAHRSSDSVSHHFIGLPIPLAAGTLVSLIIAHHSMGSPALVRHGSIFTVMLILAYLMVSNIRYRTFKGVHLTLKPVLVLVAVFATLSFGLMMIGVSPALMLIVTSGGYIFLGLVEELVFFKKRQVEDQTKKATQVEEQTAVAP